MKGKTKVLFITVRSDMGGGPKHVYELCSGLSEIDVYIASPCDAPYYEKYRSISNGHIKIPHRKFSLLKLIELIQYCRNNGINIVHSHGRGAGIYSRFMGLFGFKVVHTFHGVHHASIVERMLKHLTNRFICVSRSEMINALAFGLCEKINTVVIPNGIEEKKYSDITSPGKKILGTISRLDPHKNNGELIRFMKELPEYHLLIAGDGEEKEYLKSIAPTNVEFMGYVDDIPNFLNKIDIYVSASRGEGLPYSVLEAMAAGKKIVLSDVVGHNDIEGNILLYKPEQLEIFKNALLKAENCKISTEYCINNQIKKIEQIYE
ncbi:glycosyltransferase [Bacteriovorax sp. Seq25_V]|uniref:glycosyltransferase n=1 Tax=Bacteriovorax sp. Seq25_V TaxID=1201288 RepID=UPI00038A0162|nr:glycosyltransferase [Bacteriovorax sp. Seq25_V]EQC43225.1 glycosyltransferase, group 1 family protein [Bacteriovorax sp. Seq25_V]